MWLNFPIQCIQEPALPGETDCGLRLTTQLHLMPKLRICGALLPLPYVPSWFAEGQIYFTERLLIIRIFNLINS